MGYRSPDRKQSRIFRQWVPRINDAHVIIYICSPQELLSGPSKLNLRM